MSPHPTFTCPQCSAVSSNPFDTENGYCGRCHAYTGADLAATAQAFMDHFAVVDEIIDAITPEDTERALNRIRQRAMDEHEPGSGDRI